MHEAGLKLSPTDLVTWHIDCSCRQTPNAKRETLVCHRWGASWLLAPFGNGSGQPQMLFLTYNEINRKNGFSDWQ